MFSGCSQSDGRAKNLKSDACNPKLEEECFDPAAVIEYNKIYTSLLSEMPDPFPIITLDTFCDMSRLPLGESGTTTVVSFDEDLAEGIATLVVKTSTKPIEGSASYLVAKTFNLRRSDVRLRLVKEKAFLMAVQRVGNEKSGVPKVFNVRKGISSLCRSSIVVSEYVGEYDLRLAQAMLKNDPKLLGGIAAALIQLVKQFHSTGFVHSDIHLENVRMDDFQRIAETMHLIDFDRVEPFVTPEGRHVPQSRTEYDHLNKSPFEMDGWIKTRRDDMLRVANTLVNLLIEEQDLETLRPRFLERSMPLRSPQVLRDFYSYCLGLDFSARPDYEMWIEKFNELK